MLTTKTLTLPCPLTEPEVLAAYDRAHDLDCEADKLAECLKAATADQKEKIRVLRADAKERRDNAADRTEMRSVLCAQELTGSTVQTIRTDTGEVVDTRPATIDEQQASLPGLDPDHVAPVLPMPKRKRAKLASVPDEEPTPPTPDAPTDASEGDQP